MRRAAFSTNRIVIKSEMKWLCSPFRTSGNETMKIAPQGEAPYPGQETNSYHVSGLTAALHHVIAKLH